MEQTAYNWWMMPNASAHGAEVDHLINVLHWFMGALFVGWGIFFAYCLIRFRDKDGAKAIYEPIKGTASKYLEIGVALFEVFLLVGLSVPVWAKLKTEFPADKDALRIRVVAEQFAWNFHYAGADGKMGKSSAELMTRMNSLGVDENDPNGKDDIFTLGEVHVPVNKPVVLDITSKDVIHSFGVPALRLKQDAIPGMKFPIWFEAITPGAYDIACSQLCGFGHYSMGAKVYVDTAEQYNAWMAERIAELGQ